MTKVKQRYLLTLTGAAVLAVVGIVVWSRLDPAGQPQVIDISNTATTKQTSNKPPLRLAIAPVWSPERTVDNYHDLSNYLGPLVVVNCASIPENLIEAELFGYEKGAFTGADTTKPGLFEEAHGGSLFLDEVAELTAAAQAKLLRCIEDKAVRHVGAVSTKTVDIRVIAATHKDLAREVREGRFREDLLYRLAVLEIMVPPLRDRPEDVLALAVRFLDQLCEHDDREIVGFCDAALQRLAEHPWPGNVRELQNAVQRAYAIADGPTIAEDDVVLRGALNVQPMSAANMPKQRSSAIAKFERQHVTDALERHNGNVTHTAKSLGVHRTTLQRLMRRLGIAAA